MQPRPSPPQITAFANDKYLTQDSMAAWRCARRCTTAGMGGRHEAQDQEPGTDAMMGVVILALALILTAVIVLALASD